MVTTMDKKKHNHTPKDEAPKCVPTQEETVETVQAEELPAVDEPCEETSEGNAEPVNVKELTEQVELAKQEAEEWKDKYLRLSAEFDNYRKRTLREKQELVATASEATLTKLLPVVDDFERALQNSNSADPEAMRMGLELIYKLLTRFLQENGVSEIEAMHQELNTDFHDAVTQFKVDDESLRGKVVDVLRKGYLLNGRVLRHAQVVIGE